MSQPECLTWDAVCRRAGGRRRYNRVRQFRALMRLTLVAKLLDEYGFKHGARAKIARRLGVSRATICRDYARLLRGYWGGKEADERYRAQVSMQARIRRENRQEWDRIAEEVERGLKARAKRETEWAQYAQMEAMRAARAPFVPPSAPHSEPLPDVPRWLPAAARQLSSLSSRIRPERHTRRA